MGLGGRLIVIYQRLDCVYRNRYTALMKPITFLGDSLSQIRDFPLYARSEAGFQLREVQKGNDPADWKPLKTVGPGVREIRPGGLSGDGCG